MAGPVGKAGSAVVEFLTGLFRIPRYYQEDGTVNPNYGRESEAWRLKMALTLVTTVTLFLGHAMYAHGIPPFNGFTEKNDSDFDRRLLLEGRLDQFYRAECMQGETLALEVVIRDLQEKYEELTGKEYKPLPCPVLLTM